MLRAKERTCRDCACVFERLAKTGEGEETFK